MPYKNHLLAVLCLLSLFVAMSARAQEEPTKTPSLDSAQTLNDIHAYMQHEFDKIDRDADEKQRAIAIADIYLTAHEKALEIAKSDWEQNRAYDMKFSALRHLATAGIEDAEQKMETFLDELDSKTGFGDFVESCRFRLFDDKATKTVKTPEGFDTFKTELKTWVNRKISIFEIARTGFALALRCEIALEPFSEELIEYVKSAECTLPTREKKEAVNVIKNHAKEFQFYRFAQKAEDVKTPESFEAFKAELKTWIAPPLSVSYVASVGLAIAERNNVSGEQFTAELIEYVQSSECPLPAAEKKNAVILLEGTLRTALGSDPKLYGKTLDNEDFDWESLRGKYVLIKFTATWCGPCKGEIPGMLEAYEKYHDKGLEIISVYIWEHGPDPVTMVKNHVEKEKLPWIIISEALTAKENETTEKTTLGAIWDALAKKTPPPSKQGEFYAISGVPTMILVDKEGKIIMTQARGEALQTKLAEIFE